MKLSKKFISTAAAAALVSTAVISVPPTYAAEAAVEVQTIVIDVDGVKVVVDATTYGEILLGLGDTTLTEYLYNGQETPTVAALQIGDKFVDIEAYGLELLLADGDVEAAAEATEAIETTDFKTVEFDEDGEPILTPIDQEGTEADLTAYNEALAAVTEADYTTESWTAYQEVVEENVVTAENTQDEVDAATAAITEAQADLVEAVETLKVESVSAINANIVQVKFTQEVDKASATNPNNYLVNGTAVGSSTLFGGGSTKITLSEDKKTVTIEAGTNHINNQASFKLIVRDVFSTSAVKVPTSENVVVGNDTVAPEVTAVTVAANTATTTKNVQVKFSEVVKSSTLGTFLVDGQPATATRSATDSTIVNLVTSQALEAGKEYTLEVAGASDGINVTPYKSIKFTVATDNEAPKVTSVTQRGTYLAIAFDKNVDSTGLADLTIGSTLTDNISLAKVGQISLM